MKKILLVAAILAVAVSPAIAAKDKKAKAKAPAKVAKVEKAQSVNLLSAGACVVGTVVSVPVWLVSKGASSDLRRSCG